MSTTFKVKFPTIYSKRYDYFNGYNKTVHSNSSDSVEYLKT